MSTPMTDSKLEKALLLESKKFEEFYLWLQNSMPAVFFREVDEENILLIVHALMHFKELDYKTDIHLKNLAISLVINSPEADVKILENYALYGIKNYTTYVSKNKLTCAQVDGILRVATIYFTEAVVFPSNEPFAQEKEMQSALKELNPELSQEDISQLFSSMDKRFLRTLPEERRAVALELFHRAKRRDLCQYHVHYEKDFEKTKVPSMHIVLAWKNTPKHNFLYRLAKVVHRHNLVMRRVSAAYIDPYTTHSVLMLSFGLDGIDGQRASDATDIADFLAELVTLKYFGSFDLIHKTFVEPKLLKGNLANFVRTMMNFIHQVLVNVDPHLYSLDHIQEALTRHPELTIMLCNAFECKFHPEKTDFAKYIQLKTEFNLLVKQLDTGHEFHDARRRNILLQGINFIEHTLKTTFYRLNKSALVFRLDPKYLDYAPFERKKLFPELPFAVFFFKGMHFIGFHVRFQDLARGGLRTVYPEKKERMLAEVNTVFSECYQLAYTQNKKNKDIPEGGAKGVIFLKPDERLDEEAFILQKELMAADFEKAQIELRIEQFIKEQKLEYLHETQRSYVKNFLSLINCEDDGTLKAKNIVDYWKKPEYIYLGPDENMHNSMIVWIAEESCRKKYKPLGAFISGKPHVGINHKEYGVTSLGVNVYMEEILRFLKKDPQKDPFTLKMTGGPDGDVAGNQICNLYRYYPKTAKLLALTDVSGTIYDPQGLDLKACVELFNQEKSISFYPPEKLSKGGFLLDRTTRKEVSNYVFQTLLYHNKIGVIEKKWLLGNEMNALFRHNVHQVKADIFIPCGGRPRTLNESNIADFLDSEGKPTSLAIIEGANLYLSPDGRRALEEKGTLIIKDSSANKCGVISSSFEILAGLTLTDTEFVAHKEILTKEILERLKHVALDEAHLLLRSYEETGAFLTDISDKISERILMFTKELLHFLETIELSNDPKDPLTACFLNYSLNILRTQFSHQLMNQLPPLHKKAIIAAHIAARLVYKRGLSWAPNIVDVLPLILSDL